jgi:hypothetical protein
LDVWYGETTYKEQTGAGDHSESKDTPIVRQTRGWCNAYIFSH